MCEWLNRSEKNVDKNPRDGILLKQKIAKEGSNSQ